MLVPAGTEMAIVKAEHLRREPGGHVHAIGDVADRNRILGLAGVESGPHGPRNLAVQCRDSVRAPCNSQTEYSHAELFLLIAGILSPQAHETVVRQSQRVAEGSEMFFNQPAVKAVVSRRHRGVRGEGDLSRDPRHSLMEVDAFFLHPVADGFENREPAMTFVEMQNSGSDPHRFQSAKAADAEQ
jgi:hypothetical protein